MVASFRLQSIIISKNTHNNNNNKTHPYFTSRPNYERRFAHICLYIILLITLLLRVHCYQHGVLHHTFFDSTKFSLSQILNLQQHQHSQQHHQHLVGGVSDVVGGVVSTSTHCSSSILPLPTTTTTSVDSPHQHLVLSSTLASPPSSSLFNLPTSTTAPSATGMGGLLSSISLWQCPFCCWMSHSILLLQLLLLLPTPFLTFADAASTSTKVYSVVCFAGGGKSKDFLDNAFLCINQGLAPAAPTNAIEEAAVVATTNAYSSTTSLALNGFLTHYISINLGLFTWYLTPRHGEVYWAQPNKDSTAGGYAPAGSYSDWRQGGTIYPTKTKKGLMFMGSQAVGNTWFDDDKDSTCAVCQKEACSTACNPTGTSSHSGEYWPGCSCVCKSGWVGTACTRQYEIYRTTVTSTAQLVTFCQDRGGFLAQPQDKIEEETILKMVPAAQAGDTDPTQQVVIGAFADDPTRDTYCFHDGPRANECVVVSGTKNALVYSDFATLSTSDWTTPVVALQPLSFTGTRWVAVALNAVVQVACQFRSCDQECSEVGTESNTGSYPNCVCICKPLWGGSRCEIPVTPTLTDDTLSTSITLSGATRTHTETVPSTTLSATVRDTRTITLSTTTTHSSSSTQTPTAAQAPTPTHTLTPSITLSSSATPSISSPATVTAPLTGSSSESQTPTAPPTLTEQHTLTGIVIAPTSTQTFTIVETPTMPRSHTVSVSAASNTPSPNSTMTPELLPTLTAPRTATQKDRTDSLSLIPTTSFTTDHTPSIRDSTSTASLVNISPDTTTSSRPCPSVLITLYRRESDNTTTYIGSTETVDKEVREGRLIVNITLPATQQYDDNDALNPLVFEFSASMPSTIVISVSTDGGIQDPRSFPVVVNTDDVSCVFSPITSRHVILCSFPPSPGYTLRASEVLVLTASGNTGIVPKCASGDSWTLGSIVVKPFTEDLLQQVFQVAITAATGVATAVVMLLADGTPIEIQVMIVLLNSVCASNVDRASVKYVQYFISPAIHLGPMWVVVVNSLVALSFAGLHLLVVGGIYRYRGHKLAHQEKRKQHPPRQHSPHRQYSLNNRQNEHNQHQQPKGSAYMNIDLPPPEIDALNDPDCPFQQQQQQRPTKNHGNDRPRQNNTNHSDVEEEHNDDVDHEDSAHNNTSSHESTDLLRSIATNLLFPGLPLVIAHLMYIGIACATFDLFRAERGPNVAVSVIGVVYLVALPLFELWLLSKVITVAFVPYEALFVIMNASYTSSPLHRKTCVSRWALPRGLWGPTSEVRRYFGLIGPYRRGYIYAPLLPLGLSILIALFAHGLHETAPCDFVFISAAIALIVLAVVFLIASPCRSKAQSFLTAVCFACVALLSVMQIIALRTNTDSIEAIKSSLNYTVVCLVLVRSVHNLYVGYSEWKLSREVDRQAVLAERALNEEKLKPQPKEAPPALRRSSAVSAASSTGAANVAETAAPSPPLSFKGHLDEYAFEAIQKSGYQLRRSDTVTGITSATRRRTIVGKTSGETSSMGSNTTTTTVLGRGNDSMQDARQSGSGTAATANSIANMGVSLVSTNTQDRLFQSEIQVLRQLNGGRVVGVTGGGGRGRNDHYFREVDEEVPINGPPSLACGGIASRSSGTRSSSSFSSRIEGGRREPPLSSPAAAAPDASSSSSPGTSGIQIMNFSGQSLNRSQFAFERSFQSNGNSSPHMGLLNWDLGGGGGLSTLGGSRRIVAGISSSVNPIFAPHDAAGSQAFGSVIAAVDGGNSSITNQSSLTGAVALIGRMAPVPSQKHSSATMMSVGGGSSGTSVFFMEAPQYSSHSPSNGQNQSTSSSVVGANHPHVSLHHHHQLAAFAGRSDDQLPCIDFPEGSGESNHKPPTPHHHSQNNRRQRLFNKVNTDNSYSGTADSMLHNNTNNKPPQYLKHESRETSHTSISVPSTPVVVPELQNQQQPPQPDDDVDTNNQVVPQHNNHQQELDSISSSSSQNRIVALEGFQPPPPPPSHLQKQHQAPDDDEEEMTLRHVAVDVGMFSAGEDEEDMLSMELGGDGYDLVSPPRAMGSSRSASLSSPSNDGDGNAETANTAAIPREDNADSTRPHEDFFNFEQF